MKGSGDVAVPGPRAAKVEQNDRLLRSAAIAILAEEGWNGLSTRVLTARCGLTTGAFYARFENVVAFIDELWDEILLDAMIGPVDEAIAAVEEGDRDRFIGKLDSLAHPSPEILAATELLQAAMVEPELEPIIAPSVTAFLERRTRPSAEVSVEEATVAAAVSFVGLGLAHLAKRSWVADLDVRPDLGRYFVALRKPAEPLATPTEVIAEYLYVYPFDTGDERLDRLMQATAIEIGERGYRRATVQRICRTAGLSTGFMMSRFKTKLDLFATITEMMWGRGLDQVTVHLAEMSERLGPAMAEAMTWREMQNPVITRVQVLATETSRMMGFIPRIAELVESQEQAFFSTLSSGGPTAFVLTEFALGSGLTLAVWFSPEIRDLPYHCVTAPLVASAPGL